MYDVTGAAARRCRFDAQFGAVLFEPSPDRPGNFPRCDGVHGIPPVGECGRHQLPIPKVRRCDEYAPAFVSSIGETGFRFGIQRDFVHHFLCSGEFHEAPAQVPPTIFDRWGSFEGVLELFGHGLCILAGKEPYPTTQPITDAEGEIHG
jgi:hypothetical protein